MLIKLKIFPLSKPINPIKENVLKTNKENKSYDLLPYDLKNHEDYYSGQVSFNIANVLLLFSILLQNTGHL